MLYEKIDIPAEAINRIDPNLMAIALIVMFVCGLVMMLFYMPRTKTICKLEQDNAELKTQRDKFINELSIELIKNGHTDQEVASMIMDIKSDYEEKLKKQEGRTKQASKRSEVFAIFGEKMRRAS